MCFFFKKNIFLRSEGYDEGVPRVGKDKSLMYGSPLRADVLAAADRYSTVVQVGGQIENAHYGS